MFVSAGKTGLDYRVKDAHECGPTELEQNLPAAPGSKERESDRFLLRPASARPNPQTQM